MGLFDHSPEAQAAAADELRRLVEEAVGASSHVKDLNERAAWCEGYLTAKGWGRSAIGDISDALMASIVITMLPLDKDKT